MPVALMTHYNLELDFCSQFVDALRGKSPGPKVRVLTSIGRVNAVVREAVRVDRKTVVQGRNGKIPALVDPHNQARLVQAMTTYHAQLRVQSGGSRNSGQAVFIRAHLRNRAGVFFQFEYRAAQYPDTCVGNGLTIIDPRYPDKTVMMSEFDVNMKGCDLGQERVVTSQPIGILPLRLR